MALSITVHGQGTFTASMEEGPVTFTAAIASVGPQGAAGATGATGATGVVAANSPITYDSGTQTVAIIDNPSFTTVSASDFAQTTTLNYLGVLYPDSTQQTTAFIGEARKVYVTARNSTGSTIAKGKVVYLSGGTGNVPNIALALADSETTSARTIGITAEAISNNSNGKVIISGAVNDIDTSAFNDGDTVYLSATTAGGLTTTLPAAPLHGVVIGIVTRANPSNGSIEVAINNYQELKELSDVNVADRANNDGLFWESSSSTWRSKTIAEILGYTPANTASVLLSANNLSDLASASTARTNLGLGTMAVETASNYLLTSTAATTYYPIPTGTTSQYLRGNGSLSTFSTDVIAAVPAASTTEAGKVELATVAEAVAGTDASKAVTAEGANLNRGVFNVSDYEVGSFGFVTAVAGGHSVATQGILRTITSTTAVGSAAHAFQLYLAAKGVTGSTPGVPWGNKVTFSMRVLRNVSSPDANSVFRAQFGKFAFVISAGELTFRGIGVKTTGNGPLTLIAHNGTSVTTVATSYTPTNLSYDLRVESDGAGNVSCYVNGSLVGTTTGGPTTSGASGYYALQVEVENIAITSAGFSTYFSLPKISIR